MLLATLRALTFSRFLRFLAALAASVVAEGVAEGGAPLDDAYASTAVAADSSVPLASGGGGTLTAGFLIEVVGALGGASGAAVPLFFPAASTGLVAGAVAGAGYTLGPGRKLAIRTRTSLLASIKCTATRPS